MILEIALVSVGFVGGFAVSMLNRKGASKKSTIGCGYDNCHGRSDPRCVAGNCTYHCRCVLGCKGVCIDEAAKGRELIDDSMREVDAFIKDSA